MRSYSTILGEESASRAIEKHDSRWCDDVTRRRLLAAGAAGVAGFGVLGSMDSAAAATGEHTLEIQGFGTRTSYSFTVGGDLSGESLTKEDEIIEKSAHGAVGSGKDVYTFDGPLYAFDFDRSGEINVMLDGKPAHVGNRPDHFLTIEGTGTRTSYSFTVGGNLSGESLTKEDRIIKKSAHGAVGSGKDAYTFDGPLYAFDFDRSGEINVMLDGKPAHVGNRPDHVIAIEGTGTRTSYTFSVGSNLYITEAYGGNYSYEDEFNSIASHGAVSSGTDAYTFDGPLYSFDFDQSGAINVILDGKPAHVGNRPDHRLMIYSRGGYCSYDFSITGSICGAESITGEDTINGSSVSGAVDNNGEDSYTYTGDLTSLNLSSYADVYRDFEHIRGG